MTGSFFLSVGDLFLGFCFRSGILEIVMVVYCLFLWPVLLLGSQGMIAHIGGWDTGISWRKEGWKRRSL